MTGARTFLSAATPGLFARCAHVEELPAASRCCGQECPRAGEGQAAFADGVTFHAAVDDIKKRRIQSDTDFSIHDRDASGARALGSHAKS